MKKKYEVLCANLETLFGVEEFEFQGLKFKKINNIWTEV